MVLSDAEIKGWLEEFMDAMSAPVDFGRLKTLMSKRVTVEMPNEPKCKKFEDWEKKAAPFLNSFKSSKRAIPKGASIIAVPAKKDEVDVIVPEICKFNWTKELTEAYPNVNLSSGEKAKITIYNRLKLNSKKECVWYAPLFAPAEFKNQDRAEDDDTFGFKLAQAFNAGTVDTLLGEEVKAEMPAAGKMNKEQMMAVYAQFKEAKRGAVANVPAVHAVTGKDDITEAIFPMVAAFKWSASLNELFKVELAEDAEVELRSYDTLQIKGGKLIGLQSFFDPATCIKPVKKSGAA